MDIASFYQYFPNKEALLFHIVKPTRDVACRLSPILTRRGADPARRLRDFVREFFTVEAAEADLRRALRIASIDLRETKEFQALIAAGAGLFRGFVEDAVGDRAPDDLDFMVDFTVLLVTSFAERGLRTNAPPVRGSSASLSPQRHAGERAFAAGNAMRCMVVSLTLTRFAFLT